MDMSITTRRAIGLSQPYGGLAVRRLASDFEVAPCSTAPAAGAEDLVIVRKEDPDLMGSFCLCHVALLGFPPCSRSALRGYRSPSPFD
jgi:hypothetical protein